MSAHAPFGGLPDEELGRQLGDELRGPDPAGFLSRLGGRLARLPDRDTQWDVLAHWARPRILVAAMAAAFLLGVALWRNWSGHRAVAQTTVATVSATMFVAPTAADQAPMMFAVLEAR